MARTARSLIRSAATVTGVVAAVGGVSLAAGPAASAAEPINAAEAFNMYDVDQDGYLDPYAADTSGNGVADQNVVLVNGALMWLYDTNEDGWPGTYGTDNNGDGYDDLWGYDPNEDVVIDSWTYDPAVFDAPSTFAVSVTLIVQSEAYYG
jgi:hypothetical protein